MRTGGPNGSSNLFAKEMNRNTKINDYANELPQNKNIRRVYN